MSKPDYKKKQEVLNSQIFQDYKKANKKIYFYHLSRFSGEILGDNIVSEEEFERYLTFLQDLQVNDIDTFKECERLTHSHSQRVLRLRKRVERIVLGGDCLFLTLTFNDSTLSSTSPETRRKYVRRFLKSFDCQYVGNIDFGKTNHREHYHALIGTGKIDYSLWNSRYGAINGLKVRNSTDDKARLSRYIAKLTNHAIKETTKRSVIIYSR